MPYQACIFDLDGTLLDSLEDLGDAMNRVLKRWGFPEHSLDQYRYFVGSGATRLVALTIPEESRTEETVAQCLAEFQADYSESWDIKSKPYEGIPEMLDALVEQGFRLTVLSNKPHRMTTKCVEGLLSRWDFEIVYGHRKGIPRKPNPTAALEIIERLDIPATDCVYLGDTDIDMKTAVASGCFPVGVLWGFREEAELRENGAQAILKHPLDLLEWI